MRGSLTAIARQVARWVINVILYFVVIPAFYIAAAGITERNLGREWWFWPVYWIFTVPAWPFVAIVVPLLAVVDATHRSSTRGVHRRVLGLAGALLMGLITAIATRDVAWTLVMAVGGGVYGLLFRVAPRAVPKQQGGTDTVTYRSGKEAP